MSDWCACPGQQSPKAEIWAAKLTIQLKKELSALNDF
jgi:hypothetical protein